MKNIYYFNYINKLGGIETFLYELAKKYKDNDLTIYYKHGDKDQIKRLKNYVRTIKYNNEEIECEKAFFNYNLDIIDKIKAKEYILVIHGNYDELKVNPPRSEKITKVVAVSKDSAEAYEKLTGIKCEVCYNPLTIEEEPKLIKLVTASRLQDKCKGANRLSKLIKEIDIYSKTNNRPYIFNIFSDLKPNMGDSVCYLSPRLNIRSYLKDADYVIQLSDNEGYCYTVNEAMKLGTPCVITPCTVYKELGINETNSIILNFDLSNIKEVVDKIFNSTMSIEYDPPKDTWGKLLAPGESTYEGVNMFRVRAKDTYLKNKVRDAELNRIPLEGEEWETEEERANMLFEKGYVEIVEEVKKSKKAAKSTSKSVKKA